MTAPGTTQPQFGMQAQPRFGMQQPRVRRSKFGGNQGFNFGQFTGQQPMQGGLQGFGQQMPQGQFQNMQGIMQQGFQQQRPQQPRFQQVAPQGGGMTFQDGGGQGGGYQGDLLQPGTMPTKTEMEPFLGGAGNVKYDPYTGKKIPYEDRVKPGQYRRQQAMETSWDLATGPALQEASNFKFQNLPASIMQQGGAYDQLMGASQGLMGGYNTNMKKGQGLLDQATQGILGTQAKMGAGADTATMAKEQARAELQNLQRQALSPELDPMQRAFFQQRADERLSEIADMEGGLVDAFQRQQAGDVADLAAKGILDTTTASNVMGERGRRLGLDLATLRQQAGETSRQEQAKERERITQAAGQFGGLQAGQASAEGGLMAQLLGSQGTLGAQLGGLGTQQQGIAAELGKSGMSGLASGGELGLRGREQEAGLQQAELSTRMMGDQLQLQNLQSLLNQILGRKATQQGMDYQKQLMNMYMNPKDTMSLMNWLIPSTSWVDESAGWEGPKSR
jgi:hypothetical protein